MVRIVNIDAFSGKEIIGRKMDLQLCYIEENLFPKIFASYEERPYGILFYSTDNPDSYDSNHAVIYRDRITDLKAVLEEIREFYTSKGLKTIIYQSETDNGWFGEIKDELAAAGYKSWTEEERYMLPLAENAIVPNPELEVRQLDKWDDSLTQIFLEAEEPWEILVAKKSMDNPTEWMFVAYYKGEPIGLTYGHCTDKVCRGDYILVSKKHRNIGAGRALFYNVVEWTKANGIDNFYLWPADPFSDNTPERIYTEGGFRFVELRLAGRAVYEGIKE